jgi:microsomal dipeptidase-like Zn-dependent dipeptidase
MDQMRQLAAAGAVMELDWFAVHRGSYPIQDYVQAIREVGAEHYLISSDFGQQGNPTHIEGLRAFVQALQGEGVSDDEVDLMARRNPARLLGLD